MRVTNVQFTGLASGLDTDSIVKAIMTPYQMKIDREKDEIKMLDYKKQAWEDVNAKINQFQTDWIDVISKESTYETYKASSSSDSITVTTTGDVAAGAHKIEIEQLATGASYGGNIVLKEGVDATTGTLKELIGLEGETTLKVNGESVTVEEGDTLQTLARKIKEKDSNLNVNFDTKNNKLFISTKDTGVGAKIDIVATDNKLEDLGFTQTGVQAKDGTVPKIAQNAIYYYNDIKLESETNNLQVNGLNITLNDETPKGEPITIQVSQDTDKVVETLSGFVDAYNELIEDLNKKLGSEKTSLTPLTDEEKEKMTDKEIEEHEELLKQSTLRNDSSLRKVVDTLRGTLQGTVTANEFSTLSHIGITTGSYEQKGKLILDKDKLTKALNENPDAIKELFTSKLETETIVDTDGKETTVIKADDGLATRLNKSFKELEKSIANLKSYDSFYNDKALQDSIKSANERIAELEERYASMEAIHYQKFVAMEKSMSMLNSQSASLSSMFTM